MLDKAIVNRLLKVEQDNSQLQQAIVILAQSVEKLANQNKIISEKQTILMLERELYETYRNIQGFEDKPG